MTPREIRRVVEVAEAAFIRASSALAQARAARQALCDKAAAVAARERDALAAARRRPEDAVALAHFRARADRLRDDLRARAADFEPAIRDARAATERALRRKLAAETLYRQARATEARRRAAMHDAEIGEIAALRRRTRQADIAIRR